MSARSLFAAALLFSCSIPALFAQTAALTGTVSAGPQAVPLSGALATLRADGREQTAITTADGAYRFTALEDGKMYRLTIAAAGTEPFERTGITLGAGQTRRIDVTLALANLSQSVTVTDYGADGRGNSGEVSQIVDSDQLHDLPSVNRTVAKFALLDPHVRQAIGLGADYQDSSRLSINAGSYRNTAYVLDGTTTYDWTYAVTPQELVPLGAVQELKVLTGDYPARYGISTTGVIVIATRSGANHYHGEGFGYLRPSRIQAAPPLSPFRVPNERHDWGVLAGGPVVKDRTWLFADFERSFQQRGSLIQSPTISFFNGISADYVGLFRIDHTLSNRNSLTWRFNGNYFSGNNINDRISGFTQPSAGREAKTQAWGTQLSEHFHAGRLANEFRLSFVDYFPDSAFPLAPSVSIIRPNYSTSGYSTVNWVHVASYDMNNTATLSFGRHQIEFGGEFVRQTAKDYSYTPFGTYTFAPGAPVAGQQPVSFGQTFGTQNISYGQTEFNAFVSDEIRLSRTVTATVGLRYEFQSITNSLTNLGPRLALAWDVANNGKTIIRAGSGIFYDQQFLYVSRRFITSGPNAPTQSFTIPYGTAGFPTFPNSLPVPPVGATAGKLNLYVPGNNVWNPYSLQFSAGVQQQIAQGFTISIDAQHSHTLRQQRVNDINHPAPFVRTAANQVRSGAVADATRPLAVYAGVPVRDVAVIENSASSLYDALDFGVTKRLGSNFQLAAHYLLSSSASYSMFYADANSGIPNEWNNWGSAERAPSDFCQRHRFSGNAYVHLPFKFDLGLVAVAASGPPVNPITGTDNNGDTYTIDRPIGLGRNSLRGPSQLNLDTAVSRRLRLHERLQAELRFEATNVLNRNNYVTVNNIFGEGPRPLATFLSPIAGVANTDPSRQLRFGVRLLF
jgi:hypothetical protein